MYLNTQANQFRYENNNFYLNPLSTGLKNVVNFIIRFAGDPKIGQCLIQILIVFNSLPNNKTVYYLLYIYLMDNLFYLSLANAGYASIFIILKMNIWMT